MNLEFKQWLEQLDEHAVEALSVALVDLIMPVVSEREISNGTELVGGKSCLRKARFGGNVGPGHWLELAEGRDLGRRAGPPAVERHVEVHGGHEDQAGGRPVPQEREGRALPLLGGEERLEAEVDLLEGRVPEVPESWRFLEGSRDMVVSLWAP